MQHAARRVAGGLVLLLALTSILSSCEPSVLRVADYRLDTELPRGLLDEAPIYRVVEAPTPAADWARHVAAALGFEGEPVDYSEAAAQPAWTWAGRLHSGKSVEVDGNIAFQGSPLDGDTGASTIETAEEAVAAARAWLTARDLLPADCADDARAWPYQTGPDESRLTRHGWEVCFRRRLDGLPVGSRCVWRGGISLRLDTQGHVTFITHVRREVEMDSLVPIKTVDEAWQELQRRGPAFFDAFPRLPEYGIFTITEVALGYYEGPVGTAEVQRQFKPHYIFTGRAEIPNGGGEARVAAYVPAWK